MKVRELSKRKSRFQDRAVATEMRNLHTLALLLQSLATRAMPLHCKLLLIMRSWLCTNLVNQNQGQLDYFSRVAIDNVGATYIMTLR